MNRSMQRRYLWLLVLLFGHAAAQDPPAPALAASIDSVFADLDKPDSPGCALGVIQNGRLSYARGYGMANLEHGVPNGAEIVYDIGSTSKQFTATAILLLAQDGKLSLDDDVRRYVPELPQYQRTITVRHLLNHTSGLRDYLGLFSLAGISFESTTTEQDALDFIIRQKALNFGPGDEYLYSNSGYLLLSIIVQRISGKSFPAFAQERIFGPLGMTHTLVLNDHDRIVPRRATGYARRQTGGFMIDASNFEQTGDGAVMSSIEDLFKWDRNFYEPKIGGEAWLHAMHTVGKLNDGQELIYASGLEVDRYRGLRRVKHAGAWAGYRAELLRFPDHRLSVVCLCNAGGASETTERAMKVAALFLESELDAGNARSTQANLADKSASRRLTASEAVRKVGVYRDSLSGALRRITFVDGELLIDSFSGPGRALIALGKDRFTGREGTSIEFVTDRNAVSMRVSRTDARPVVYQKVEAFEPTAEQLAAFAGTYFSEELNVVYILAIRDRRLFVTFPNGRTQPLLPSFSDAFASASGTQLEFRRDRTGDVLGFAVQSGRIRGVNFTRRSGT